MALLALLLALVAERGRGGDEAPDRRRDLRRHHPDHGRRASVGTRSPRPRCPSRGRARRPAREVELRRDRPRSTTAASAHPPIPRVGLNSAGVPQGPLRLRVRQPDLLREPAGHAGARGPRRLAQGAHPGPPNQTTGWVAASDVDVSEHRFHGARHRRSPAHLLGRRRGRRRDRGGVGKDTTPTPIGEFYLSEKIQQQNAGGAYGPYILATNAYSEALDLFDSGLPVIAFHGTNQPGLIGTAASNGCIRMPNEVVTQLAETLPAGTPVVIVEGLLSAGDSSVDTTIATAA